MKLIVLAKNSNTYFIRRLTEEVGRFSLVNPWERKTSLENTTVLVRTTGVYGDDRDLEMLENGKNLRLINPLSSLKIFREKSCQYEFFQQQKLPLLPWTDLNTTHADEASSFIESLELSKILVKPNRGQGGWGIKTFFKYHFIKWYQEQLEKGDLDYLVQPYVQGEELRVFFIGEKIRVFLKRIPTFGVAANFQAGGGAEVYTPSQETLDLVERAITASGAFYGAIDLIKIGKEDFILELNTVPGFEQIEKVSNQNLVKLLVEELKVIP